MTPRTQATPVVEVPKSILKTDTLALARQMAADNALSFAESEFHVIVNAHEVAASQDIEKQLEEVFEKTSDNIDKYALVTIQIIGMLFVIGGWVLSNEAS
eukprot:CAMPEP_0184478028 /NCGR_PEP_ID=MMETSP0113_2-20130426/146_1 /TAXON_ID=91329 /ORGANISM="Norrisiella sphaerica, Strain BC52" /LENGTH=99 /DNA_ID=CAMNT_0026855665 /DNA_START=82 /DNA_END=381 /DNA_ORIENTATION=+